MKHNSNTASFFKSNRPEDITGSYVTIFFVTIHGNRRSRKWSGLKIFRRKQLSTTLFVKNCAVVFFT